MRHGKRRGGARGNWVAAGIIDIRGSGTYMLLRRTINRILQAFSDVLTPACQCKNEETVKTLASILLPSYPCDTEADLRLLQDG